MNQYQKGGEGREVKVGLRGREVKVGLRGRKEGEVKMGDFHESQS